MHNSHVDTDEQFDLASFEVDSGYFKEQIAKYEDKYRDSYPNGWGQFFAEYSNGLTDKGNLDYDEWAFLCEHFMYQSWTPPANLRTHCPEKPETVSGFFIVGAMYCLIHNHISRDCLGSFAIAMHGKTQKDPRRKLNMITIASGKSLLGSTQLALPRASC